MTNQTVSMNLAQEHRETALVPIVIFVFLLPFVQMGFSFYVSVQMILFVYLLYCLSRNDFLRNLPWYYVLFALIVFPSLLYTVDNQLHMIARSLREFFCISVLLAAISHKSKLNIDIGKLEKMILGLLIVLFLLSLLQFVALKVGYGLYVPPKFLIANQNTLKGFERALEFRGLYNHLRPTVFYGEPSYLSFIVTTLLFMVFSLFKNEKNIFVAIVLTLLICMLSRSFSGALAFVMLTSLHYTRSDLHKKIIIATTVSVVVIIVLMFSDNLWFMERLFLIGKQKSSVVRLFTPFKIIKYVFQHKLLGMPQDLLEKTFSGVVVGIDNGFLNIFINYGVSGFIIWGILLCKTKGNMMVLSYIVLSSMFNGAFLAFDKIAIMGFALLLVAIDSGSKVTKRHLFCVHSSFG